MTLPRLALVVVIVALATAARAEPYVWNLPDWLDPPTVPADNPITTEKVELGRRLFYELNLAGPSYMSCATCRDLLKAFTDGRAVAIGVASEFHPRNSMGLQNIAYHTVLTWADPNPSPWSDRC